MRVALEMRQVFGQVPGQGVVVANHTVAGAGVNEVETHDGCVLLQAGETKLRV